jgi:short-subunit dehydrogenase
MRRNLHGRVVLITGATRGIGRLIAEHLARLGARLALNARSPADLDRMANEFQAAGATALPVAADLTASADRERLVRTVADHFGGLDVLINNAGVASFGEFATSSEAILRQVMDLNFFAPAELMRLCLPHLTRSSALGRGAGWRAAVVNMASLVGKRGIPSFPEHSTSKFALCGLSESLRAEFARFDVDVLVVVPGLVRTEDRDRHLLRNEGQLKLNYAGSPPAERVADEAVKSLVRNYRENIIGFKARWINRGNRWFPWFVNWVLAVKVRAAARRAAGQA